jgi:carboxyl-terminal processing protease
VVVRVPVRGTMHKAGVRIGDRILSIDRIPIATLRKTRDVAQLAAFDREITLLRFAGDALTNLPNNSVVLTLRRDSLPAITVTVPLTSNAGKLFDEAPLNGLVYGGMRDTVMRFQSRQIGVLTIPFWQQSFLPLLEARMAEWRTLDGIVIDLRGNIGGSVPVMLALAKHFLPDSALLATVLKRSDTTLFRVGGSPSSRVPDFGGPVAILVDGLTASLSEVFTGAMQAHHRAIIVGDSTAGRALAFGVLPLPGGDNVMFSVGELRTPTGAVLEGHGVRADVPVTWSGVPRTASDSDVMLTRALEAVAVKGPVQR